MPLLPTLAFLAALLDSSTPGSPDTTPPVFVARPELTPSPNASTPLAARLVVQTDEPTRVQVFASDGSRTWRVLASAGYAIQHDLALAGFRAGRAHTLRMVAVDQAGNRTPWPFAVPFTTAPLPATFPPLHVTVSIPSRMEAGFTLAGLRWTSATLPGSGTFLVFLDAAGEVVWLHQTNEDLASSAIRLRNGHLFALVGPRLAREIDLLGNTVAEWWAARLGLAGMPPGAIPVDCDSFHHELDELPAGDAADFVTLSHELRIYADYPASEIDPTLTQPTARVVGDEIVEFRRDGAVVRRKSLLDVLDPYRMCYDTLAPIGAELYGAPGADWSHANAVAIDPADGDWIVSLRHQDAVVKLERGSGALRWILGPPERWAAPWSQRLLAPRGAPFEWPYHQHSPHVAPGGSLVLYDNGNYRAIPPASGMPANLSYSRAVAYRIDPVALTVRQAWQYDGNGQSFFSRFFCDADPLPLTGNVLVADGFRKVPGANRTFSRIVEVTGATPSTAVFEVIVNDPATSSNPYNWSIYRSERYPSLYP